MFPSCSYSMLGVPGLAVPVRTLFLCDVGELRVWGFRVLNASFLWTSHGLAASENSRSLFFWGFLFGGRVIGETLRFGDLHRILNVSFEAKPLFRST